MKKAIDWIFTPLSVSTFALSLLVGHVVLLFGLLFGERIKGLIQDIFNFLIFSSLKFSGTRFKVSNRLSLPEDRPLIIISNHQSMIDIPFIGWVFRKHHPKFVAKLELGKGSPYVSLSLRNGAGVLVDRKNPTQAIKALEEYGSIVEQRNYSICIFPEGTRARDGKIKKFKSSGIRSLLKVMPRALIVPISIDRSWELVRHKMFPVPFGIKVTLTMFSPIEPKDQDPEILIKRVEEIVRSGVDLR